MKIPRREWLKTSLGAAGLAAFGPTAPAFLARTALAAGSSPSRDTILVVVQLAGGNDGLNTVVPYGDDLYAKNRRTLRLPTAKLHVLDHLLGLHPEMEAMFRLYQEGSLAIVQGVGYPHPNQSHSASMHVWQTAVVPEATVPSPSAVDRGPERINEQLGWIGRTADRADSGDMPAAFVGQIRRPIALNGHRVVVPTIRSLDQCHCQPAGESTDVRKAAASVGHEDRLLQFVQQTTTAAYASMERIENAAGSDDPGAYPAWSLAKTFQVVSRLIRAELGIRIFYTELGGDEPGGFDNHAGQRDNHAALLRQLSDSVAALVHDLKRHRLADRVVLMTFSEFGRTVEENGRRGTDHGSAAPMFLVGGKIRGGLVGPHPSLAERENGGLKFHTDFRRVYATMLDRWLGLDSRPILGTTFDPLPLV